LAARWPARSGLAFIGAAAGYRNLISIDIGGTSADIGVIYDGAPGLTDKGHIVECPLAPPVINATLPLSRVMPPPYTSPMALATVSR